MLVTVYLEFNLNNENSLVSCPYCKTTVSNKKLNRHIRIKCSLAMEAQKEEVIKKNKIEEGKKINRVVIYGDTNKNKEKNKSSFCPHCKSRMKQAKIKNHIINNCVVVKEKEAKKKSNARMIHLHNESKEIKSYLQRNPAPDSLGKFGLPQAKIRHGTYGIHSMEYDPWSKDN